MRGIGFTADITNDAPATTTALANLEDRKAKAVARGHAAAHDRRTIGAHDDAVIRPASRSEIQSPGAHMRLQLGRTTEMRETERFRIDGAAPNENGQATPSPAVSVESGVHVDHQALPQIAFLPKGFRQRSELGKSLA